ncbi:MAG: LysM peptidoglycan-binding domain-containing protein [Gammaproteobacteria bacterium]
MTRSGFGILVGIALFSAALAQAGQAQFPRPHSLQPAITFWTRVYTEVDSGSGFVHDNRNLAVIYEILSFKPADSNRRQQRRIEEALERYRGALLALAGGKRTNLTPIEQRALVPWGKDATAKTLRAAADNLRFQRGQSDGFRDGLIRAGAWDRQIRAVLQELGVPEALAALPYVESSYHPSVRSSAGAAGLWQFTRFTGRRYLRVDHVVDERLDPLESTTAAARLLQYNHSILKSWPLAITAYNHGLSGMRRAVRVTGTDDIGTIVRDYDGRLFGFASRNFYASFLAALDVSKDYRRYFGALTRRPADNLQRIELPAYYPAEALSEGIGVDMTTLQQLNPALQPAVWDGRKYVPKGYRLRLPDDMGGRKARERLALLAATDSQTEQIPDIFYQVERGDTLSEIAQRYRTTVTELMAMNGLHDPRRVRAGTSLRVLSAATDEAVPVAALEPATKIATTAVRTGDSKAAAAVQAEPEQQQVAALDTPPDAPEADLIADPADYEVGDDGTIEIQAAETLGHYADWLQTHSSHLRRFDGLGPSESLRVGRRLKLDFSTVSTREFEQRRLAYHQAHQAMFFQNHRITGDCTHSVRTGDSLWVIAARQYGVPFWLLRQYNPDVNLNGVLPEGTTVLIPMIEDIEDGTASDITQATVNKGSCAALG